MSRELAPFAATNLSDIRGSIDLLEQAMLAHPTHLDIVPVHRFVPGLYAREITIPAGALVVGKIHRTEHINVLSKGDISVLTENGIERIQAPATIISKPGTKRVGYAHTEVVWTTFHATNETDLEKLEAELIAPSHDLLETRKNPELEEL